MLLCIYLFVAKLEYADQGGKRSGIILVKYCSGNQLYSNIQTLFLVDGDCCGWLSYVVFSLDAAPAVAGVACIAVGVVVAVGAVCH